MAVARILTGIYHGAHLAIYPTHQETRARILAAPREQQLALFVRETRSLIERAWPGMRLSEDSTAWYLTIDQCVICVGVQNAGAPICGQLPALISGLAKALLGRRIRVAEVECHAMAAPACIFAVYKD